MQPGYAYYSLFKRGEGKMAFFSVPYNGPSKLIEALHEKRRQFKILDRTSGE